MPPETEEYRQNNPNSPFRTALIGTKVTHKQYNTGGEVVGQEHGNFRIRWDDNKSGSTTWHDMNVLIIHWGSETKVQRGDVVTLTDRDVSSETGRFVVTQIEENGDIEVLTERGEITSLGPNVNIFPNMRERGLAILALTDQRRKLTVALDAEDAEIEKANQMIREAQDRRDEVLRKKGMLADFVDEMLYDS